MDLNFFNKNTGNINVYFNVNGNNLRMTFLRDDFKIISVGPVERVETYESPSDHDKASWVMNCEEGIAAI
jgi:hypothetical protein